MAIPEQHMMERLSLAYIRAVVARAGATFQTYEEDYGFDAQIRGVNELQDGFQPHGEPFDVQIKATKNWFITPSDEVSYALAVKAYNKLIRTNAVSMMPCLLLLYCLPRDFNEWLAVDEEHLIMRKCCYWAYITGFESANASSQTIYIPRTQLFTPGAVSDLLRKVEEGYFSNGH